MSEPKNNEWIGWGLAMVVIALLFFARPGPGWITGFIVVSIIYLGYISVRSVKKKDNKSS